MKEEFNKKIKTLIELIEEGKDCSYIIIKLTNLLLINNEKDGFYWDLLKEATNVQISQNEEKSRIMHADPNWNNVEGFTVEYNLQNEKELLRKESVYLNLMPDEIRNFLSYRIYMPELGRPNERIYED